MTNRSKSNTLQFIANQYIDWESNLYPWKSMQSPTDVHNGVYLYVDNVSVLLLSDSRL